MKIGRLEKVELRKIWSSEPANFTCWLEDNIEVLSSFLDFDLEVIEREKKVGTFSIDLYAQTPNGDKVIIENQLEKTDHNHLGQIITYSTNLESNIVIWIAKEVRQEHANAINWLNESTDINFYLIQVEAYSINNSSPAPYFKLVCQPDEDMRAVGADKKDFSEREKFNLMFWEMLIKKCKGRLNHFCNKKPSKYHYHSGSSGKSGFSFVFNITSSFYGVELYIDANDQELNKAYFHEIHKMKSEIELESEDGLQWDELPEKRASRVRWTLKNIAIMNTDWKAEQEKMIEAMERFEGIFRPIIKSITSRKNAA